MEHQKNERILEIFFRALKGEKISPKKLSEEYHVSTKSISRDVTEIQSFLTEHRELMQNAELTYSHRDKSYILTNDEFLKNKELFAIIEVLLGSRCFSKHEILNLISKLKNFSTIENRTSFDNLIRKEVYHYNEVKMDCHSLIDNLWRIVQAIEDKHIITISYFKMDRSEIKRKIKPLAIMFSEYYFYLIAYQEDDETFSPRYFRIDRIFSITENRNRFILAPEYDFDEGSLREKSQFMFPGEGIKVVFEFTGLSVQAILDRLPTAKITSKEGRTYTIEADVNNGRGLMMYLLSQGAWVKVLSPQSFVDEMKTEIEKMKRLYGEV
ncbi:MAG TPA: WYL domain-containing protein [Ruminococcus sp.]|nr:WYL domain-containing protein [Ruminococcus sp.]